MPDKTPYGTIIARVDLIQDDDGRYAATWEDGATWDHPTVASALDEVAAAIQPADAR